MSTAAAAQQQQIANAIKASGVLVSLEPGEFQQFVGAMDRPLIVHARSSIFGYVTHKYLTSYRGLAFTTSLRTELSLPADSEWIEARSIHIPG